MLTLKISNQSAYIIPDEVVSDSIKHLAIRFEFSPEWEEYAKTAVFRHQSLESPVSLVLNESGEYSLGNNTFLVPWEVIKCPEFTVSVFGTKDGSRITTKQIVCPVAQSGYGEGDTPTEPTQTEFEQLETMCEQAKSVAEALRTDAENGRFKGDTGAKGADGKTPVKGVDYFTDSDIASLGIPKVDGKFSESSDNAQSGKAVAAAIAAAVGGITDFELDSNNGVGYASLAALKAANPTGRIGTLYLVINPKSEEDNAFNEYFWTGSKYELAGMFGSVNTSNFATKDEAASAIAYASKTVKGTVRMWLVTDELTNETTLNIATED